MVGGMRMDRAELRRRPTVGLAILATVVLGGVYAVARFDLQWAPPVPFHRYDPARAP